MISTTRSKTQPKHKAVYNYVLNAIKRQELLPGARLPSERILAAQLQVNEATVRRAFQDLVAGGLVERKIGVGTYLKSDVLLEADTRLVTVLMSNYRGPFQLLFQDLCSRLLPERGWEVRIVLTEPDNVLQTFRALNAQDMPVILLGDDITITPKTIREMQKSPRNFVVIAQRVDHLNIPSVVGDDSYGVRILIEHLRQLKHERIALLRTTATDSVEQHWVEKKQVAVWRSVMPAEWHRELEFVLAVPPNCIPTGYAYQEVLQALKRQVPFTALLCLQDVMGMGAAAACAEFGKRVPEDISIVAIGDTEITRFCHPPLTCLNSDLEEHLVQACNLIEHNFYRQNPLDLLRLIQPALICRKSTGSVREFIDAN